MSLQFHKNKDGDRVYTLKKESPKGLPTESARPAHFSPDDKYSMQRVVIKTRFGLLPTPNNVPDSQILVVGNLSSKVREEDVRRFFKGEGDIWGVWFPEDGKPFCYVKFATRKFAQKALERLRENKTLLDQEVWLNMKLECGDDEENFEVHAVLEQGVTVSLNNIDEVQEGLRKKYEECGRVIDVFVPKYHLKDNKRVAFVRFDTQEALTKALSLNLVSNYAHPIHVPSYIHYPSEIISDGGYGGLYGYQDENGNYTFEDHLHREVAAHVRFDENGDEIAVEQSPLRLNIKARRAL